MSKKSLISLILAFIMLFTAVTPAFAAGGAGMARPAVTEEKTNEDGFTAFFRGIYDRIMAIWNRIKTYFEVKNEKVINTMNRNAIHMLKSVTDTICDSFIITTEDGKVIVIDGGHRTETDYFVEYLKAATGQSKPHIDAWFLSHAHDDHCEVFLEVAENRSSEVTFGKVYANFPEASFYDGYDEWGVYVINEFNRLMPLFADKVASLKEGDVFNIGAAKFTVFYTFNSEWKNVNEGSTIMRMDLGDTSVMFTGDAGVNAGNYVVEKYASGGLLDCDFCKMAHHGQDGVDRNFYEAVFPEICLWPTPTWVWDNRGGNLKTLEVRGWIEEMGVKQNYVSMDGSRMLYLVNRRIVTTTDVFEEGYPAEKAVDRLAKLGYTGIDMGFDYWVYSQESPFLKDNYLEWAKGLKARADEAGIAFTHAHAPGEADAGEVIGRSIKAAAALGVKYCVIHPVWRDKNGDTIENKSEFISVNAAAIKEWLPLAEKCGVILLSENILWGASADPRIIADLVKTVDSEWFGWCYDTGHAHCSGYKQNILKKCSVVPLSLHIQDNDGGGDGHLIPGDGTIDWDVFIKTLREIGYMGDCVMEAHHQSLEAPDNQRDAILARLLDSAEKLREQM